MAGFDSSRFIKGNDNKKDHSLTQIVEVVDSTIDTKEHKKRTKNKTKSAAPSTNTQSTGLAFYQSNEPYMNAYADTNEQLDSAIKQLDALGNGLMNELINVQSNKTLRNKYNYINDMTETISGIISTKIGAIKEKNKTINDVNNMELKRLKDLKLNQSEEDDNARIMNLYDAFINTPVGTYGMGKNVLGPSMQDLTSLNTLDMDTMQIGDPANVQEWQQGLSPAENRMLLESQGKIETVVFFDNNTGDAWYEVVDKETKQPVPNVEKPDNMYIGDLDIRVDQGYAKDPNRNVVYPLIIVNQNGGMSEY